MPNHQLASGLLDLLAAWNMVTVPEARENFWGRTPSTTEL